MKFHYKVSDNYVQMFEAPPGERKSRDIYSVLPVAMMKTKCFKGLDKDTVAEILQKAVLLHYDEDVVIIKQGDVGDMFYIILQGKASVYLDTKHEEKPEKMDTHVDERFTLPVSFRRMSVQTDTDIHVEDVLDLSEKSRRESIFEGNPKDKGKQKTKDVTETGDERLNRRKYGTCVTTLDRYHTFGELALIYPNRKRNASVIADQATHVLAISHDLFCSCLQDTLERDLDEKRIFIQTHPFFSKWNVPTQRQLQWSLVRSSHRIGDHVIRQGENVGGLYFLISGRARLAAEPLRHKMQFPDFFSKTKPKSHEKGIPTHGDESTLSDIVDNTRMTKNRRNILAGMDPMTYIRRADGYAAAEKVAHDKLVDLCIIEEGEVICDSELLLGVDKNMFSVICTTACTFFHIDAQIFDRMIYKKNPHTLAMMKFLTETKLTRRLSSNQGQKMPILSSILFKTLDLRVVDPTADDKKDPSKAGNMSSKSDTALPRMSMVPRFDRSRTLTDWFVQGRTPFLQPITKDAIYYREMIQKRAQSRETARRNGPKEMREFRSLARRVKDSFWYNLKEGVRAQNTMKRLKLQSSDQTPVSRWK